MKLLKRNIILFKIINRRGVSQYVPAYKRNSENPNNWEIAK
jgi:hypothetical protein